jgi:cytosine/adenosine deaminase-related metal-dependent hydrolase
VHPRHAIWFAAWLAILPSAAFPARAAGPADPAGAPGVGAAAPAYTVFRNVKVLAMTSEEILPDRIVVVEDGRIAAIGAAGSTPIPEGARVIDGQGGTLIPGLIDLHTHVGFPEDLDLYLAHGVTTVVNLSGDPGRLEWRRELREGWRAGPRLLSCGPHVLGVKTAEQAAATVREIAAGGYDCVKIYDDISAEGFRALVAAASEAGLRTIAHIPRNLTWQDAMEAGPDAIAHAEEFLYSPVLEGDEVRIADGMRAGSISLVATLVGYDAITRQVADLEAMLERPDLRRVSPLRTWIWGPDGNTYRRRFEAEAVPRLRWQFVFQRDLVASLRRAGIRILAGTDAGGVPFVFPGSSLIEEIEQLASAGLGPFEALRAATADAAGFLGLADRLGTLEPGKEADLVLLRANPLLHIGNLGLQAGVMARGRWFPPEEIRAMLRALSGRFDGERRFVTALNQNGLEAALALAPAPSLTPHGCNELGYVYLRIREDSESAIRVFEHCARTNPSDWNAWDSFSEALEEGGRGPEAVKACGESLRLNPRNDGCRSRIERLSQTRPPTADPPERGAGTP